MAAEVALAAFSSIVEAAKYLFKKIQKETSYVFKYQSYVDGLKNQVEELGYKRERVVQPVNHAKQQGDEIYVDVAVWLNSFDDFTEKVVKPINGYEDEAKKRCFKGSCPNLFKRYSLSKKAEKASKEGADLLARGNFPIVSYRPVARDLERKVKQLEFLRQRVEKDVEHAERQGEQIFEAVTDWLIRVKDFSDKSVNASEEVDNLLREGNVTKVSYLPAPDRTKLKNVKDYEQFDSRMKVFHQVMEALKDNKFNIIGVYGMGGVGKTTLVKQVAMQVMEDKFFDEVVMAEVSQTPEHMTIQNKFAYDLGMKFDLNENVHDRAERLRERFKKGKRVLIVLDNIWKKIEFEDVGIPFENDEKERRCTIILTSRRQDLLSNQMNSRKNFSIEILSKNEAWQLFEKIVGDSAKQSSFHPIANEIVERCGGLPVALSTVANALKNKRLAIWKDALKQLRSSNRREIPEMDANVYSSIEFSYNFLESNEAKSLFLLCGLFSEGHPIKVRCLIRYGMGLGLFENVYTLEEGRNRVSTLIDTLKTSCLLLDGDVEDEVKMHDIIHVVAVLIAAEKHMFNITNAAKLKKEIENIKQKGPTTISLSCKEYVYELPEQLECPQLKLLLFTKGDSSGPIIPDLFFEGMKELKVLHLNVLYLDDFICVPSLPSSLGCLINLQTLCLENCELEDIAIVGQLKNLEILSFRDSNIQQLPLEIGQLTGLQLLDLSNCWWLEVIASNVISRLSRLEELYMNSFTQWEKVEGGENANASLLELKGLSALTTLEICIPDVEFMPQDLVSVKLERYRIFIGDIYRRLDEYKSSRLMLFSGPKESIFLGIHKMKMLLKGTEFLFLTKLKSFPNVVHELDQKEGFQQLKHLHINDCFEILHIVSSVALAHCQVFPLLESLFLYNLINLEKVCESQLIHNQSFSNLRVIKVKLCVRLKQLFSFSLTKNLLLLQKVEVSHCYNLETAFGPNMEKPKTTLEIKEIITENDPHEKVIFPNLEILKLEYLPKLTSFVLSEENTHPLFHEKVGFPRVEVLMLKSMDKLRQIWHHLLASDSFIKLKKLDIHKCHGLTSVFPSKVFFPILEELKVSHCGSLKYLFSYSMVNNLARLQFLEIEGCDSMEVVVGIDEGKLIEMVFPKLHYLDLSFLPKLTSFAVGINLVKFPSLLRLGIDSCSNLRRFISTSSSEENTQFGFDKKVNFPSLEELKVRNCGGLKYLFSYSMVNILTRLQHLNIYRCDSMEMVVGRDESDSMEVVLGRDESDSMEMVVGRDESDSMEVVLGKLIEMVFPKLHYLNLSHLPKLTSFAAGINLVKFPSLLRLGIDGCSNLRRFISTSSYDDNAQPFFDEKVGLPSLEVFSLRGTNNLEQIWQASDSLSKLKQLVISRCNELISIFQPMVALPNLMTLSVSGCNGLRSLMTLSIAESMVNLTQMNIWSCEKLEEIIQDPVEEEKVKEDHMVFSQLRYLQLGHLPSLTCFCLGKLYTLEFSSLERVYVSKCPNMKTFSHGELRTPKLHKLDGEYYWEGNLNSTIQKMFKEMVGFDNIRSLELSLFPRLREIWHGQELSVSLFNNLTNLVVDDCMDMSSAISMHLLRCLNNLKSLKICNCDSLEEVFHLDELNADEHFWPIFQNLEKLKLINLPKLQRCCNFIGNIIELPSLSYLWIENCPNMEVFISNSTSVSTIANKEPQEMTSDENFLLLDIQPFFDGNKVLLPCLTELKLYRLPKLLHLWRENSQSREVFESLTTLQISECDKLEKIIQEIGEEVNNECILFMKLKYLGLDCLPSLTSFCLGNYTIEFPSLKRVVVRECPNMKTFSQGVLYTPQIHKLQVKGKEEEEVDYDDGEIDDLNSTIQKLFKHNTPSGTVK